MRTKLKFNVIYFHKNGKNDRFVLDTSYKHGLYPKFEEKPTDGQNKTLLKFLDETACPFHSATELGICSNFMEFGQNSNFQVNFGNCQFRNDKKYINLW